MTPEERARDSRLSYDLAVEIWRERLIRSGEIAPRPDNPTEIRWASEGVRDNTSELETVA